MQVPGIYLLVSRRLPAIVSAVPSAPDSPRPHFIRKILKGAFQMNRLRLNTLSLKADKAISGQKKAWKKALTRISWVAPTLGISMLAVLLILFSTARPSHGQTISD